MSRLRGFDLQTPEEFHIRTGKFFKRPSKDIFRSNIDNASVGLRNSSVAYHSVVCAKTSKATVRIRSRRNARTALNGIAVVEKPLDIVLSPSLSSGLDFVQLPDPFPHCTTKIGRKSSNFVF